MNNTGQKGVPQGSLLIQKPFWHPKGSIALCNTCEFVIFVSNILRKEEKKV